MATLGGNQAFGAMALIQVLGAASGLIAMAGTCSLYAELRRIKDGVDAGAPGMYRGATRVGI